MLRNFDFENYPMTDEARAIAMAYDRVTDNLAMGECGSRGMPMIMGNPYPRDFIDQGDTILMRLEEYDVVRTIHLNSSAAVAPSIVGHSTGQWEDGTLVVTTTDVADATFSRNVPFSDELEIVERFTPSADGSRLDYQVTIEDPTVFLEPVQAGLYWIYVPGVTVEPYECVDG